MERYSIVGLPSSIEFTGTQLYTWVERGTERFECLVKKTTQCPKPGLKPGVLNPETIAPDSHCISHLIVEKIFHNLLNFLSIAYSLWLSCWKGDVDSFDVICLFYFLIAVIQSSISSAEDSKKRGENGELLFKKDSKEQFRRRQPLTKPANP